MDFEKNAIENEIKEILGKVARIKSDTIANTASLRNELCIDSLQAIQIAALLENRYDIKVAEVDIFNVDNVVEIVDLVKDCLSKKNEKK